MYIIVLIGLVSHGSCYRGNRELAIHYRGQHWTDDDAATVEFPRRMDKLTLQCAELIPGRDNCPNSDSDGDDEDDLTYVPPVRNRVDRSIDEDYDGDSASGSELDELSSDTDDPGLHRMEEDSVANCEFTCDSLHLVSHKNNVTAPPPSASAVDDTTDASSTFTMTTHDVNMDAEDDRADRETDDAMSITCTEDGADVNMPARTSENVPPVAVAPPKRVRAPRRTAKKAAAPRASAANPRQAFPDGTSAAHTATPHATDASSRGRSGARNTQHASKPRAATTTPPPKLKRTHSVVESPGKAPSTEAPRAKRVVYERYIERVVVYDAPGAESAPPHIQHFRVYPVDEYEAAQPPLLPPMGHPQGRYPATARSQSTAGTPRSPVPQDSFARDVSMEYTPTQSQFYTTQAVPMARSRSDTGTTRTPPFAANIPAGHAPAQPWSDAVHNIARPQAVPTAAPRRPTAGLRPNASDLRRHVVKLANEMSDEQLMLQFQQVNNLGSPRLPQDR